MNSNNNYIIQITSGRGPAECCWAVAKALAKLITDLKRKDIKYEVVSREKGLEANTLSSVCLKIGGSDTDQIIEDWQGTIQWIGQSPYRKFHKRKNWFIGINCSQITKTNQINEKDISYQTVRSSGPGGQNVNKVSTAVRAIHKPSGLQVIASDTRSQLQNKKLATQRLFTLFQNQLSETIVQEQQDIWNNHNSLIRGNPKKIFKGKEFIEVAKNKTTGKSKSYDQYIIK